MNILFATNNENKRREVQSLLPEEVKLITLAEAGMREEIPEPFDTLQENAQYKIRYVLSKTGMTTGFSEDSGLFIHSLQGKPGAHSAHYAGPQRSDADNISQVLRELEALDNRAAFFQTTICLVWDEKEYFFNGICKGNITHQPSGEKGFGYDPIFQPEGADHTFAEMDLIEKNRFSHRQKAVQQLVDFFHQVKKNA